MSVRRLLIAIAALVAPAAASAQSAIVLWPTDPKIVAGEQATALWLENHGKEQVTLQVRAHDWAQTDGTDQHTPTQAIVSSPPIARIDPGQRQLVRVIRRGPPMPGERSYRLLVDELPRPPAETQGAVAARLAVQMRYSLPLFTYGAEPAALSPQLTSRVRLLEGKRWIEITNAGTRHARLTNLRAGSRVIQAGLVGYVLPGVTMRWALPDDLTTANAITVAMNGTDTVLSAAA